MDSKNSQAEQQEVDIEVGSSQELPAKKSQKIVHETHEPARNLSQYLARRILKLKGWKLYNLFPDTQPCVIIGTPHTSNWDFLYAMLYTWSTGMRAQWLGKKELFRPPMGWLMHIWGGIPVDRSKRNSLVEQAAAKFDEYPNLHLLITPEGTRAKTDYWRTGFYYIAKEANVPIALGMLNVAKKEVGVKDLFYPTDDVEKDFAYLREYYADVRGFHPERESIIVPRKKNPQAATEASNT